MTEWTVWTAETEALFLGALGDGLSVSGAARAAGIARQTAYNRRNSDEAFAAAWNDAIEAGTDSLEDEALRRAKDGTDRPVYQKGALVGHIREYSDTLAMFLLKGRRPEKFKERSSNEHTGSGGGPIQVITGVPRPDAG